MITLAGSIRADAAVSGACGLLGVADLQGGPPSGIAAADRVALCLRDPLALVRMLAALDGQVEAVLLLSGGLAPDTVAALTAAAGCTRIVSDRADLAALPPATGPRRPEVPTRWLMTTSGTTGLPKIVPHTLASLSRSTRAAKGAAPVWGLLYDPTRFAGMQVVLQALIGGGRLVVPTDGPLPERLARLAAEGVTHLSATPTLWRRILMVPDRGLELAQITLGGEIADQSTLAALRAAHPQARITHIYASTEAGVGFSVKDGQAGFPAAWLHTPPADVAVDLRDGILWLRPPAAAFIDTGDRAEIVGDRVLFRGRDNGMMNIGGVKVFPETVESVLMTLPEVALAKVSAKASPVTGALVLAEVQLAAGADPAATRARIIETARAALVREAVPAIIRFVSGFETNAAGKIVRSGG